jgi:signal peptidase II
VAAVTGAAERRRATPSWGIVILAMAVVILDQITKTLVLEHVALFDKVEIIPGLLDVVHIQNAGVAFGILNDVAHPQRPILTTLLALLALGGIVYYSRHIRPEERVARVGLALIFGGAVGNLVDRLRYGHVVDFIDVYAGDWHFWAFNVADASISVGAVLVFVELLFLNRHASHSV